MSARKNGRRGPNVWVVGCRRGFAVRYENERHCFTRVMTQGEAMVVGRRRARRNGSDLIVQVRRGCIRRRLPNSERVSPCAQ